MPPHFMLSSQTAQVASQQGKYLGHKFTRLAKAHDTLAANMMFDDDDSTYDKPFFYRHLGSLAYIGNAVRLPDSLYDGQRAYVVCTLFIRLRLTFTDTRSLVDWLPCTPGDQSTGASKSLCELALC